MLCPLSSLCHLGPLCRLSFFRDVGSFDAYRVCARARI